MISHCLLNRIRLILNKNFPIFKNMTDKINFQIQNNSGLEIDIDCRFKKNESLLPAIFFCHGFNGFKDWGGFPFMMERLAAEGFFAVSFNFSHNGVSKTSPMEFSRLDLFAENT